MDEPSDPPRRRRRPDPVTAIMMVVTATALLGAIWLKTKGTPVNEPPRVGAMAPPLRLLDLETSEPVFVGQRGTVVWVVFWPATSASASSSLAAIERASVPLRPRRRFALVAAAVDFDQPARVRAAAAESRVRLPVYLANAETLARYDVRAGAPPLHVLIDADGRIAAIAREAGPQTIERIADQAKRLLLELDPLGDTRFASEVPRQSDLLQCE